ncbi:MAG: hypothetical protein HKM02_02910 [Pseudomonadales bacterium]|nr:hypothetical protein [Pseudomonadales bacterium]
MNKLTTTPSWRLLLLPVVGGLLAQTAHAVPSFARQTGMACEACHSMFPELTPFGRQFKLNGYTMTGIKQVESQASDNGAGVRLNQIPPLSAMIQTQITNVRDEHIKNANGTAAISQDNISFPRQFSLFYAGEVSDHMGAMLQVTGENGGSISQDNSEVRYANQKLMLGVPVTYGVTLNNSPGMEDLWQNTPTWGYPFIHPSGSPAGGANAANAFMAHGLGGAVAGLGAYTMIDNHYYADFTLYRSTSTQSWNLTNAAPGQFNGLAPYGRLAYQTDIGNGDIEIGGWFMAANLTNTGGLNNTGLGSPSDRTVDRAIDLQYELPMGNDELVVHSSYVHESDDMRSTNSGMAYLNSFKLQGEMHFNNKQSVGLMLTRSTGTNNDASFNITNYDMPVNQTNLPPGAAFISPQSTAWVAQYYFLPWENVQLGAQYWMFTKYNGNSGYNYNNGDAHANDTAMLYGWFLF